MKIIYQDLKCHRFSSIVLLLIVCLCSLPACSGRGPIAENVSVSHEVFEPYGLAQGLERFSFESDSIGYAATTSWENQGEHGVANFTLSFTEDRGRTWRSVGKGLGEILYLSQSENNIYYVTKKELRKPKEPSTADLYGYEIWKTEKSNFMPYCMETVKSIKAFYGILGFHVFNDSTLCYFIPESDSIRVSYDGGNSWDYIAMQRDSVYRNTGVLYSGDYAVDFDGDKIYVGLGSEGLTTKVGEIDVYSMEQKYYQKYVSFYLRVSGGVLALGSAGVVFYDINNCLTKKERRFNWTSFTARTEPKVFEIHNGLMLCYANKWNGKTGKRSCVGCSSDGGNTWKKLLLEDRMRSESMTVIPDRTGVSFMYPDYVNSKYVLHILKFQKN